MGIEERRRIAVIGASRRRAKYGNKCVRAYRRAGWTVYPIHPHADAIEDLPAYPSLAAAPTAVDRISVYVPPHVTAGLLEQLPAGVEIFFNPGSADAEVLAAARRLGLDAREACSIVDIGFSPSQFPDTQPSE